MIPLTEGLNMLSIFQRFLFLALMAVAPTALAAQENDIVAEDTPEKAANDESAQTDSEEPPRSYFLDIDLPLPAMDFRADILESSDFDTWKRVEGRIELIGLGLPFINIMTLSPRAFYTDMDELGSRKGFMAELRFEHHADTYFSLLSPDVGIITDRGSSIVHTHVAAFGGVVEDDRDRDEGIIYGLEGSLHFSFVGIDLRWAFEDLDHDRNDLWVRVQLGRPSLPVGLSIGWRRFEGRGNDTSFLTLGIELAL